MQGKILLAYIDRRDKRALFRILRSTRSNLDFTSSLAQSRELLERGPYDMLLVDYDHLDEEGLAFIKQLAAQKPRPHILVLCQDQKPDRMARLFQEDFVTNMIAKDAEIAPEEIVITVEKILRNDLFGLQKYLTWGIQPEHVVVTHSRQKDDKIEQLARFADYLGLNKRLITLAKGVADEFLTNAVYNAPVDEDGNPRYAHMSRTERVDLEAHEHVELEFACDGRYLAIGVVDRFGTLKVDTIRRYMHKCFRGTNQIGSESGGAGMGFYFIFQSLSQFIINIDPGRRTEVIGLLDVRGSYRDFAERPKSFNVFVTRPQDRED